MGGGVLEIAHRTEEEVRLPRSCDHQALAAEAVQCPGGSLPGNRTKLGPHRRVGAGIPTVEHLFQAVSYTHLNLPSIEVTGTATSLPHDVPQSLATVSQQEITEQGISSLQDVLRNVPGITINAGEGGAHGDSVNLRGLSVPDSFFLDGLRDIGLYQRDTFDEEAVEVLLGPSSVLFGRGSTAGVINQVTKQATLTPIETASLEIGTAGTERATADLDLVLGDHIAARINLMDQRFGVADRDDVLNKSYGMAPTVALSLIHI